MKIEFWSDFRCPICYIAKHEFLTAIIKLKLQNKVQIYFRPFVLDPNLMVSETGNIHQSLSITKGISIEQAQVLTKKVEKIANQLDLPMDYENCIDANTEKAHLLSNFALEKNLQFPVHSDLMHAYFVENQNIDDDDFILKILEKYKLDPIEWADYYENDEKISDLQNELIQNREQDITIAPFIAINDEFAISGAKSNKNYYEILKELIKKS